MDHVYRLTVIMDNEQACKIDNALISRSEAVA